jgi:hypothetical protein
MFDMSLDSKLFKTKEELESLDCMLESNKFICKEKTFMPIFESKLMNQYNHRANTFEGIDPGKRFTTHPKTNASSLENLMNPDYTVLPRYWVEESEVKVKLLKWWKYDWLIGFKNAVSATADLRSMLTSVIPVCGVGNSMPLIYADATAKEIACLFANMNSIVFDYCIKQKVSGQNLNYFILNQIPVIPRKLYTTQDIEYITSRVLELTYTANDIKSFATDLGYQGEPFVWNEERRLSAQCELDAYFAHLYKLSRDDIRYILDPSDVMGEDFPATTFPVLKRKEIEKYGEYRTQRLVLEEYDRLSQSFQKEER